MDDFKSQVKKGFTSCKNDIESLKDENNNLKEQLQEQNIEMSNLKSELKGIRIAIDLLKDLSKTNQNVIVPNSSSNMATSSVGKIESASQVGTNFVSPASRQSNSHKKDAYEELLKFKARINKREVLKQKMISMVSEQANGMNLSELKFLFIEHYHYCSKATFYNYLKELEIEKKIEIKRERNKNFVYVEGNKQYN